ncbi:MAG: iron-sulfur cluster biosynthesis family protein [Dehalococcoidia bacterium]|nr:iron-sulfur cluster biosynthesis family protein [Dehalococcoidia bacterium]
MIEVTSQAAARLKGELEARGLTPYPLRIVAVRGPHGCIHGYTLAPERELGEGDRVVEESGVRFVVHQDMAPFLDGARIDWDGAHLTIDAPASPPPRHEGHCEDHHAA